MLVHIVRLYSELWVVLASGSVILHIFSGYQMSMMMRSEIKRQGVTLRLLAAPPFLWMFVSYACVFQRFLHIFVWVAGANRSYILLSGGHVLTRVYYHGFTEYICPTYKELSGATQVTLLTVYDCVYVVLQVCFWHKLTLYWQRKKAMQAAEYFVSANSTRPSLRLWRFPRFPIFSSPSYGSISLPLDGRPVELHNAVSYASEEATSAWEPALEFSESIRHWSSTCSKSVWITSEAQDSQDIAKTVGGILLSIEKYAALRIVVVNVSEARSTLWPLIYALMGARPEYRDEIGRCRPEYRDDFRRYRPFAEYFEWFLFRPLIYHGGGGRWEVSLGPENIDKDRQHIIDELICEPLLSAQERLSETGDGDPESTAQSSEVFPAVLVVHGVTNPDQADELRMLMERLQVIVDSIAIVVVTESDLLRYVLTHEKDCLIDTSTLYVSETGSVVYSGKHYSPPMFYENLFSLMVKRIHRIGGATAERMLRGINEQNIPSSSSIGDDPTEMFLANLQMALAIRKRIFGNLSKIGGISQAETNERLGEDNKKIAEILAQLLELNTYRAVISSLPEERGHKYAVAALNMTNNILHHGWAHAEIIKSQRTFESRSQHFRDYGIIGDNFFRRARRFLNWLAAHLDQLPEELSLRGIVLLNEQPVGGGGFSNVYHGEYQTHDGVRVHVALKLLKIFEDQTPDARRTFVQEALVWHQLRHPNIVPFLGVDSTTFPAPARAMVSLWMSMGNVREYIAEHSPASIHAINLLDDVAQGLKYLHSVDVVHGDLCGRNILIDADGHACLSDFGLALFTDPESSRKSLTRAGSRRWMSPELLLAPKNDFKRTRESDVWAFGCVCCEIWTEGVHPFNDLGDGAILLAVSELSQQSPYPTRPTDSTENVMPDRLWQIVQSCFQSEPSERPTGEDLAELFAKKKAQDLQQTASGSAGPSSLPHHDHTVYSPPRTSIPPFGKGKARQKDEFSVVRFGPIDADPAQTFPTIFQGLASRVKTSVLSEPTLVEYGGLDHLLLHFPTLLEANNFAMTWMVYRFAPYLDVVANVVDGQ